jgi:hypothetical protein
MKKVTNSWLPARAPSQKAVWDAINSRTLTRDDFRILMRFVRCAPDTTNVPYETKANRENTAFFKKLIAIFSPVGTDAMIEMRYSRKHRSRTQTFTMVAE